MMMNRTYVAIVSIFWPRRAGRYQCMDVVKSVLMERRQFKVDKSVPQMVD
jgi:hypothetical protein